MPSKPAILSNRTPADQAAYSKLRAAKHNAARDAAVRERAFLHKVSRYGRDYSKPPVPLRTNTVTLCSDERIRAQRTAMSLAFRLANPTL